MSGLFAPYGKLDERTAPHHRAYADKIAATYVPEATPSFTLERHVRQAREQMGEARWTQLMAEWEQDA